MKIILLQSYEKLGKVGEIVNVKPGFARNFLIPNKTIREWVEALIFASGSGQPQCRACILCATIIFCSEFC